MSLMLVRSFMLFLMISTYPAQSQTCNFVSEQAVMTTDIPKAGSRLELLRDEIDLSVQREVFEDVLLRHHSPVSGTGVVFGFWKRVNKVGIDDSMTYEYWTLQVPVLRSGVTYEIPHNSVVGFFSSGGSVWVGLGQGFYGSQIFGSVAVKEVARDQALVDVNLRVHAIFAAQQNVTSDGFVLKGSYILRRVSITEVPGLEKICLGKAFR